MMALEEQSRPELSPERLLSRPNYTLVRHRCVACAAVGFLGANVRTDDPCLSFIESVVGCAGLAVLLASTVPLADWRDGLGITPDLGAVGFCPKCQADRRRMYEAPALTLLSEDGNPIVDRFHCSRCSALWGAASLLCRTRASTRRGGVLKQVAARYVVERASR